MANNGEQAQLRLSFNDLFSSLSGDDETLFSGAGGFSEDDVGEVCCLTAC